MERLKKAMEIARAEREQRLRAVDSPVPHMAPPSNPSDRRLDPPTDSSPSPSIEETGILFARTPVVALDPKVLRRNRLLEPGVIGTAAHSYKMLRTQVLQRLRQKNWNTLAIVSPVPGEGKTFTAINLAIAISGDSQVTSLLVDLDMRRPSVHKRFGIEPRVGVAECLQGDVDLSEVLVHPLGYERLLLMPGSPNPVHNSSELLSSDRAQRLFREIKDRYQNRIVLYDLPPVLGADDALSFMPQVDAALVVVGDGVSKREELLRLFEVLRDVPIIGTVLNGSRGDPARKYAY